MQGTRVQSLGQDDSPGKGNSQEILPLQYPHLGNSMDREAWQAVVHDMTKTLNHHHRSNHFAQACIKKF